MDRLINTGREQGPPKATAACSEIIRRNVDCRILLCREQFAELQRKSSEQ